MQASGWLNIQTNKYWYITLWLADQTSIYLQRVCWFAESALYLEVRVLWGPQVVWSEPVQRLDIHSHYKWVQYFLSRGQMQPSGWLNIQIQYINTFLSDCWWCLQYTHQRWEVGFCKDLRLFWSKPVERRGLYLDVHSGNRLGKTWVHVQGHLTPERASTGGCVDP